MSESNIPIRPIVSVAISPRTRSDLQRLQQTLIELFVQDPTLQVKSYLTESQIILSGMGYLQLEVICDCIQREHKIEIDVGTPSVIYLETIRKQAEGEGKYVRQTGGHGQYAHVKLRLEPRESGSGYLFVNETTNDAFPAQFVEPVNFGLQEAMKGGVLAGHEMVDLLAVLCDGSFHVQDSNEMAFRIAASMAFKEAARKASPLILEPVMVVEVVTPEDFAGTIMNDLSSRRGRIEEIEIRAGSPVIRAIVPLSEMFGYAMHLHCITQGRAEYSMQFGAYEEARYRDESGPDEAVVTANLSKGPRTGSDSAAAELDAESD